MYFPPSRLCISCLALFAALGPTARAEVHTVVAGTVSGATAATPWAIDAIVGPSAATDTLVFSSHHADFCSDWAPATMWTAGRDYGTGAVSGASAVQELAGNPQVRGTLFEASDQSIFTGAGHCGDATLYRSTDNGLSWQPAATGTGPFNSTFAFAEHDGRVYAGTGYDPAPGQVYRWLDKTDAANDWELVATVPSPRTIVRALESFGGSLFAGTQSYYPGSPPAPDAVWVSDSGDGGSFAPTAGIPEDYSVDKLIAVGDTLVAYAFPSQGGSMSQIYRWDDTTRTWDHEGAMPMDFWGSAPVALVLPDNAGGVYGFGAPYGSQDRDLYRSVDLGLTWEKVAEHTGPAIESIAMVDQRIYLGTTQGAGTDGYIYMVPEGDGPVSPYGAADLPMTFSVDVQGPIAGNGVVRGSDILTPRLDPQPANGLPNPPAYPPTLEDPPQVYLGTGGAPAPGLTAASGFGEVDALSFGTDPMLYPEGTTPPNGGGPRAYVLSVDEHAIGLPRTGVRAEGAHGNREAAADTFIEVARHPEPPPPNGGFGTNYAYTDGDGVTPSGVPGVGLAEPSPATPGSGGGAGQIDGGDNLDAVDFDSPGDPTHPAYFSYDSAFRDPLETAAAPPGYGTAAANGFVGGDVAMRSGGQASLYASAASLGLDLAGADTDDLDALVLSENGLEGYQVSLVPYDWIDGTMDMLLFSVSRGSAVIGALDSIFGRPIEEGDVLTSPCAAGSELPFAGIVCAGGGRPGIFTAAEALGLATVRSGTAASWGLINPAYGRDIWADELDALDVVPVPMPGLLLASGIVLMGLARRMGAAS